MTNSSKRLDARGISHLSLNPKCLRRIRVYQVAETPDKVAGDLRGQVPLTMSPFQRQIGIRFERGLLENSASKLLGEFHRNKLLPPPAELDSNGIINMEDHYGSIARAKDPDAQLELLAEKTELHLRRRMSDDSSDYLILNAVLKLEYAGFTAYIRPDFLIVLHGETLFYPGEIKSILMLREDTKPADLDKMKRQAAVEFMALQRLYQRIVQEDPETYAHIDLHRKKLAMLVVRQKSMEPCLFQSKLEAELDFLADAETVLLEQYEHPALTSAPTLSKDENIDEAFLETVPATICDTCESECGLAAVCREGATRAGQISALGEDLEKIMPQMNIKQVMALLSMEEPPSENDRLLRERLLNELEAVTTSGGLLNLDELKGGRPDA